MTYWFVVVVLKQNASCSAQYQKFIIHKYRYSTFLSTFLFLRVFVKLLWMHNMKHNVRYCFLYQCWCNLWQTDKCPLVLVLWCADSDIFCSASKMYLALHCTAQYFNFLEKAAGYLWAFKFFVFINYLCCPASMRGAWFSVWFTAYQYFASRHRNVYSQIKTDARANKSLRVSTLQSCF